MLHRVRMSMFWPAMDRFLKRGGLSTDDVDARYMAHTALMELTDGQAGSFNVYDEGGGQFGVELYVDQDPQQWRESVQTNGHPMIIRSVDWETFESDPIVRLYMGRVVPFRCTVLPTVRSSKEVDVFFRTKDLVREQTPNLRVHDFASHTAAHQAWITRKINNSDGVEVRSTTVLDLSRNEQCCTDHNGQPTATTYTVTEAIGLLIVKDESGFETMLMEGIGRHTTFGYGMVRVPLEGELIST